MRVDRALAGYIVLLLLPVAVSAVEGRVAYLSGEVTVTSGNTSAVAEIGMPVSEGDTVETGANATAIIELGRDAEIKLRANTITRIRELEERIDVELESGGLFAMVKRAVQKAFSVNTQSVVAGVRGTQFFVAFGREIEDTPDVWVCVNEGSVDVEVPQEGDRTVVREGEGINVLAGRQLTGAQPYDWTQDLNWNMDPQEGEVADDTDLDGAYEDLLDQDYD
ncbi:MAG: FecR family protein [Spirochaetota bacterium]